MKKTTLPTKKYTLLLLFLIIAIVYKLNIIVLLFLILEMVYKSKFVINKTLKLNSKIILFTFFNLFLFQVSFGQTSGDFRSKGIGPAEWNIANSWETHNGTTWINATTYPGQNSGVNMVTIQTGHTIKVSTNFTTAASFNNLIINGVLDLIGGGNPKIITISTNFVNIDGAGSTLKFSDQKTALYLPANAAIEIKNNGTITGSCSNNTEIYIGGKLIGVCNGGGGGILTFGEIVTGGGTLNAIITSPTANPYFASKHQSITPTGTYTGAPTSGVTYKWDIQDPEGIHTTFYTQTIPSITLTKVGYYLFTFTVTTLVSGSPYSNSETLTVNVSPYFDSDGDGITDNIDIDDDNDGNLDIIECPNFAKPRFLNSDFEDKNITSGSSPILDETALDKTSVGTIGIWKGDASYIPNWNSADLTNNYLEIWQNGHSPVDDINGIAYSGNQYAEINASSNDGFYQDITTTPGDILQWSFAHRKRTGFANTGKEDKMRLLIGNPNSLPLTSQGDFTSAANASWTEYTGTYVVPAGQTTTRLTFTAISTASASLSSGNFVDNVQLFVVPNCKDTDGDGIPDYFDLDSDNDGIPDVVEAGLGNLSQGKATLTNVSSWVDTNSNGMHNDTEGNIPLDSDGDGVPNYIDLDSDNDSVFDVDESGAGNSANPNFQNGDGDINGDGVGYGPESETFRTKDSNGDGILETFGDGILDIYDYFNGTNFSNSYGNINQGLTGVGWVNYTKDTDGDGIPDYLDLTSNGTTFDIANNKLIYDYKIFDANNDGKIDGLIDIDKDGIIDLFDTNTSVFGSPRDLKTKLYLDFDGRNDYGESTAVLGGLANATLMAWIDLNPGFTTEGVVVGQNSFQLRITAAKRLEAVVNGTLVTFNTVLNTSQWYHVAAVYDGANIKLYLNGSSVGTQAKTGALSADVSLLTLGKDPSTNTKFFKGKIDEIRVFNVALSDSHLQRMVYQEIQDFSGQIRGAIVPKNIATTPTSLPFSNLLRYYRMDFYKGDVIDDLTTPAIDLTGARIYNHKNIYVQQAPMPFLTERNGTFATAVNSPSKDIRGLDVTEKDWSIVKVQHDITDSIDNIDLGMLVDSGKKIIMNGNRNLQNDWYLKLDGIIDLEGESQLVQTTESDLDATSSGWIEKDQKGQANKYNYNYWSSPVNPINSIMNNTDFTVAGVMKDGTTTTPLDINWISGYNGALTTPISLARYWLFKFENNLDEYANWIQINETSPLRVGQGYIFKGSGIAGTQNYTFLGKPNNGTIISNKVSADQLLLVGNPYPSALNASKFIIDNVNSVDRLQDTGIDGTLYFWEHSSSNNTHVLSNYTGGYAVLNLVAGIPPVAPSGISGVGLSAKIPGQYIPVGQGFFVYGKTGIIGLGDVVFNNSQRNFVPESNIQSNTLFKNSSKSKKESNLVSTDTIKRIRLGFNSADGFHRQILLGFMGDKATSNIDYGYDSYSLDDLPNDMYFLNGEEQLVIEGEGFFNTNTSYPIGIKTNTDGKVEFILDGLENFNASQPIYIHDTENNNYHDIRKEKYEVDLSTGEYDSRFSLRFIDKTYDFTEKDETDIIKITHVQSKNLIAINNKLKDVIVQKVYLYNSNAQFIMSWKIENQEQEFIQLPIKKISSGVYIVRVQTSNKDYNKKIIIP